MLAAVYPQPIAATLAALPAGAAGTRATLAVMARLARKDAQTAPIRNLAIEIVGQVAPKDYAAEAAAVQAWVKRCIRYVRDVAGVETLTPPVYTIGLKSGDCDDQAMLVAALLTSIGARTRFVAIGPIASMFRHVYTEVFIPGRGWLPIETTEPWAFGRGPRRDLIGARLVQEV